MKNAPKIGLSEVQKFQKEIVRFDTDKRIQHDAKQDKALIVSYLNGDDDSGWELFKSYIDEIAICYRYPTQAPRNSPDQKKLEYDTLSSYEKEDLLQEIACQFFELVNEYDMERPFENVLRSKLRQRVFNRFFAKELDIKFNEAEFEENEQFEEKLADIMAGNETTSTPDKHLDLYQALNQLGARKREVVTLSVVKGWSASEIALELGISRNTAKATWRQGLAKLKAIMNPEEEKQDEKL